MFGVEFDVDPGRFAEADLDGVFAEGPDLPDLGRVRFEEQNSKGSSGTSLLQRSFLIRKELRVHGQVGVCMARRGGKVWSVWDIVGRGSCSSACS